MRQRKVRADTTTRGMIHSILPEPGSGRILEIIVRSETHTCTLQQKPSDGFTVGATILLDVL